MPFVGSDLHEERGLVVRDAKFGAIARLAAVSGLSLQEVVDWPLGPPQIVTHAAVHLKRIDMRRGSGSIRGCEDKRQ